MNETPDYQSYSLDQLYDVHSHIDREKYPDRYRQVVDEINKRIKGQTRTGKESAKARVTRPPLLNAFRYHPPEYIGDPHEVSPWQREDIAKWLLCMACLLGISYMLSHSTFLRYRPWIAQPLGFAAYISLDVFMIIYGVRACRNHPSWQPTANGSLWWVFKECLVACKYLLVVALILTPITLLLDKGFGIPTDSTRFLFAKSAPSNIYIVIALLSMFTLGPVAEEWFFRGVLYNALRSKLSIPLAASVQALIFTSVHVENLFGSIAIFALGVALAVMYERRKNLLSPIILHVIKNGLVAIPLVILTIMNFHVPAKTWEEAKMQPGWFNQLNEVQRQADGMQQFEYARNKWGGKGSKQWKKEINGFATVCKRYPDQRTACAKAQTSAADIYYYYLNDPRRAILRADDVVNQYPDQTDQAAKALNIKGWAYYRLRDFKQARQSFNQVLTTFNHEKTAVESAQEGLMQINALEKGK
jgi:membrane protease YdiL (CAAX protease family)